MIATMYNTGHSPQKLGFLLALFIFVSTLTCALFSAWQGSKNLKHEIQEKLLNTARMAAALTDGDLHQTLIRPEQKNSPDYLKVQAPYRLILNTHDSFRYVYTAILREGKIYFIVDTQPEGSEQERTGKERKTTADIMEEYADASETFRIALERQTALVEDETYVDEWGVFLSAYAPIYNSKKEFIGIVGVDKDASVFNADIRKMWAAGIVTAMPGTVFSIIAYYLVLGALNTRKKATELLLHFNETLQARVEERTFSLQAAKEDAERANRLKSEFLANVTHELRTPVHCILNYAQIGGKDIERGRTATLKEHFDDISANAKRLDILITDLLDLSKIEQGEMDFSLDSHLIRPVIENAVAMTRPLAEKKHLRVDMVQDAPLEPVIIDKQRMEQVCINLMSNAIRYSPEKGTITWRISQASMPVCGSSRTIPSLKISISNHGPSLPPDELEAIFEHFVQGKGAKVKEGSGLGLTICRRFLKSFHGTIRALNLPEGGVCFEISLPLWHKVQPSS